MLSFSKILQIHLEKILLFGVLWIKLEGQVVMTCWSLVQSVELSSFGRREFGYSWKGWLCKIELSLQIHEGEKIMKNKSLKNLYSWVVQPVSSLRTHQQLFQKLISIYCLFMYLWIKISQIKMKIPPTAPTPTKKNAENVFHKWNDLNSFSLKIYLIQYAG